jgi:hypothetical protein
LTVPASRVSMRPVSDRWRIAQVAPDIHHQRFAWRPWRAWNETALPSEACVKAISRSLKPNAGRDFRKGQGACRQARAGCQGHRASWHADFSDTAFLVLHAVIARAIETARGKPLLIVLALGGSVSDYVFAKILGKPAFVTPHATHDEANHAPYRNLESARSINGIRTGAALLTELALMNEPE